MVRQCVILLGGLGTRLGALTAETPKPLLPVAGAPFLEVLIGEARRRGFDRFLLLAGFRADVVRDYIEGTNVPARFNATVEICVEPEPLGTGGALVHALPHLDESFLLLNGDTWFDFNWLDIALTTLETGADCGMALRLVESPDRYETIALDGKRITEFRARQAGLDRALINGGVYVMKRACLENMQAPFSLEGLLLPRLAQEGRLAGVAYDGFFIDIGIPQTYEDAQTSVPAHRRRPAIFLDRDGVLNEDTNYAHKPEEIIWKAGAKAAVKRFNDLGCYVFVVTNQAGVAHGLYEEQAIHHLHDWMAQELRAAGACVDDWRYCPYHPRGKVEAYTAAHPWRKPEPGMLLDLLAHWPVDKERSLLIGDRDTDIAAAQAAGLPAAHLFTGDNLLDFINTLALPAPAAGQTAQA